MPVTAVAALINDSILETIGNTPLVRLSRIAPGIRPQLLAAARSRTGSRSR